MNGHSSEGINHAEAMAVIDRAERELQPFLRAMVTMPSGTAVDAAQATTQFIVEELIPSLAADIRRILPCSCSVDDGRCGVYPAASIVISGLLAELWAAHHG